MRDSPYLNEGMSLFEDFPHLLRIHSVRAQSLQKRRGILHERDNPELQ